jgi:hypothetical protein
MELFIVEMRKGNTNIEILNCFISLSIKSVIKWINNNKDFEKRSFQWWWVIIKMNTDEELSGELYKIFDWDGNEVTEQPIDNNFDRNSLEYELAEKIIFLQDALNLANKMLNQKGNFGVIPSRSVSFYNGQQHHKKVRDLLKKYK